ncbi:Gfo/Idh/MocA family protein [uncultured Friedmanniella sp.]|uniref:Gfo/Idh/MocA family protein n=1 Tax=uncultured Friedmanniella sp. TaxID=335381 RepID=UPI0035CB6773
MRVGLVSFAHVHAASYATLLSRTPDVELLAADPGHTTRPPSESGGRPLAAELGVAYVDSYDDLYAWRPDAVVICSENVDHRNDVVRAAAARVHVLCEKPLATTSVDAAAMTAACEQAGVFLMVAHPVRFAPAFAALRAGVAAGDLGAVRAVSGTNNGQVPTARAWFTDPARSGGGAVTDHVVHLADLLDALLDGQRVTSVYAVANRVLQPDRDLETAALVSLTYANGVTAVIDCSWSRPAHYPTWGGLTLNLVTDAGLVDLDPFGQRVDGYSESTRGPLWLGYGTDLDQLLLTAFLDSVRTGVPPQPDGHVGYRTVRTVEAAYESLRLGQPVDLTWD